MTGQSRDHVKPRDDAPNFGYNDLYAMQQNFYDNFVYPNNIKQRNNINSTVFSEDVSIPCIPGPYFGCTLDTESPILFYITLLLSMTVRRLSPH